MNVIKITDPTYKSLLRLRQSAIDMGLQKLAIMYQISLVRMQEQVVMARLVEVIRRKRNGCGND